MGYLTDTGKTLTWQESQEFQEKIKRDGVIQYLTLAKQFSQYELKDMIQNLNPEQMPEYNQNQKYIYWGEEIESHLVTFDDEARQVRIVPCLKKIFQRVESKKDQVNANFEIHPEYGNWMIETVPKKAYTTLCRLDDPINSIRGRSKFIKEHFLDENEYILQVPVFGMLGVGEFQKKCVLAQVGPAKSVEAEDEEQDAYEQTQNQQQHQQQQQQQQSHEGRVAHQKPRSESTDSEEQHDQQAAPHSDGLMNGITHSLFLDDRLINPHPRFPTLTENIRRRRGEKVQILVPLYQDRNTNIPKDDKNPFPGYIYMDTMAFGMGSCCLQSTFSAIDMNHARWLYDQLAVLSPLLLPLTAGSPFFRGLLADTDTRWDSISMSVDCRTPEERDPQHPRYIPKSRYSSISYFISNDARNLPEYNNVPFPLNTEIMDFAAQEAQRLGFDLDERLKTHLGFLFKRDALVIYSDKIDLDNSKTTAHYENIQSTNWNSVRMKLPPSFDTKIGWRVEFRTMEVQLTDDENIAFSILIEVFVRMLYEDWFGLNFYIPMDKVDANFERARVRDAVTHQRFFFRTNLRDSGAPVIREMTLLEIFFGAPQYQFEGLANVLATFLEEFKQRLNKECFPSECAVKHIFEYLRKKMTGEIKTLAHWMRDFITQHPEYKEDSVVTPGIAYDLYKRLVEIQHGIVQDSNFQSFLHLKKESQPQQQQQQQQVQTPASVQQQQQNQQQQQQQQQQEAMAVEGQHHATRGAAHDEQQQAVPAAQATGLQERQQNAQDPIINSAAAAGYY